MSSNENQMPARLNCRGVAFAVFTGLLACGIVGLEHEACGQAPPVSSRSLYKNRLQRPTVSPYLNLYRNDSTVFPNYQTLVRPQLQQRAALGRQQQEIDQLQTEITAGQRRQSQPATGHTSRFRYFSHYYGQRPTGAPQ